MSQTQVTKVTISDCAKALDEIEREIEKLQSDKKEVERKITALRTQGLMISQLVKHLYDSFQKS